MTLSWTQLTSILTPKLFGRWGTLLERIAKAITIQESQYHCSYEVDPESFKRVNHRLSFKNMLINPEPDQHKASGRYADENAVPQ